MKRVFQIIILVLSTLLILVACGGTNTSVEKIANEEKINKTINVNEKLNFEHFDVEVKTIKVYENEGVSLADIMLEWLNKKTPYPADDKMTLFVATTFDVKQDDISLNEKNDAWNPANKNSSDVFFPNVIGGKWQVKLTYELIDNELPLDIIFTPNTKTEGSEIVSVEIIK